MSIHAESSEYHQLRGAGQFSDLRIQPMLDERLCRYLRGYVNVLFYQHSRFIRSYQIVNRFNNNEA